MARIPWRAILAAILAVSSLPAVAQEVHCSGPEERANLERYMALADKVLNAAELSHASDAYAADFVWHDAPADTPRGPAPMRRMVEALREAFPDRRVATPFVLCAGDMMMVKQEISGTNSGPLLGRPPTGKPHRAFHSEMYRFRDGRIVEQWGENPFKVVLLPTGWRLVWPGDLVDGKAPPSSPSPQPARDAAATNR
jgi:predicted ester cyclase